MEILLEIREEMSREADFDVDLFAEMIRSGKTHGRTKTHDLNEADGKSSVPGTKNRTAENRSLN